MDRALVERMVGAVVLVLLLVLFAPALLDGTSDRPMTLPVPAGEQDSLKRTAVILLNESASTSIVTPQSPEPARDEPVRAEIATIESAPIKTPPEQTRAPAQPAATPVQPSTPPKGYSVQVGSFGSRENANQYASEIQARGFNVFVVRSSVGKNPVFRVYSGTEATREAAEKLSGRLSASGYSVMVVHLGDSDDR